MSLICYLYNFIYKTLHYAVYAFQCLLIMAIPLLVLFLYSELVGFFLVVFAFLYCKDNLKEMKKEISESELHI